MLERRGTPERENDSSPLFRSPESRKSNASEFRYNQPDGPARNSPLQEAKHVPFFAIGNGKKS